MSIIISATVPPTSTTPASIDRCRVDSTSSTPSSVDAEEQSGGCSSSTSNSSCTSLVADASGVPPPSLSTSPSTKSNSAAVLGAPPSELNWRQCREALVLGDWQAIVTLLSHYDFFVAFGMSFYKSCRSMSHLCENEAGYYGYDLRLNRYQGTMKMKGMIGAMPPGWKLQYNPSIKFFFSKMIRLPALGYLHMSCGTLVPGDSNGRVEFLEGACQGGQWDLYFASASLLGIREGDLWQGWCNVRWTVQMQKLNGWGNWDAIKTPLEYAALQGRDEVVDLLLTKAEVSHDSTADSTTVGSLPEDLEIFKERALKLATQGKHSSCVVMLTTED